MRSLSREKCLISSFVQVSFLLFMYIIAAFIGRISVQFDTGGDFFENLLRKLNFVKIGKNYRSIYIKT